MRAIVEYSEVLVRTVRVVIDAYDERSSEVAVEAKAADGSLFDDTTECRVIHDEITPGYAHGALYLDQLAQDQPVQVDQTLVLRDRQSKAAAVVEQLIEAYQRAEISGGSVDWSDIDAAHALARECQI